MLRSVEKLMRKALVSKRCSALLLVGMAALLSTCDGGEAEPAKPVVPAPAIPPLPPPRPVNRPPIELPEDEPTAEERISFYLSLLEGGDEHQVRWASEQLGRDPKAAAGPLAEMLTKNLRKNPFLAQNILTAFATVVPAPGQVPAIGAAAKSPDHLVRKVSAGALGNTGSAEAVPFLLDLLTDSFHVAATQALLAIGRLELPEGFDGLVGRFPDNMQIETAVLALDVLERHLSRERFQAVLSTGLESDQPAILIKSLALLMRLDREKYLPLAKEKLVPLRNSPFEIGVVNALAIGQDPELLPELIEAAGSANPGAAVLALGRLAHYEAEAAVQALWKSTRSGVPDVRRAAWIALIEGGQPKAFARADALLESRDPADRVLGAELLALFPERPSGPLLTATLEDEELLPVARKLASGIALAGYRPGAAPIVRLLAGEKQTSPFQCVDAKAASESLLNLGPLPEEAVAALIPLATSKNEAIRVHTARVLGRACSGPEVRAALVGLLADPSVHVRAQAVVSWLALPEATVDVLLTSYATEADRDMLKTMRKVAFQLFYRWPL
jgi:HEAT repeat protein